MQLQCKPKKCQERLSLSRGRCTAKIRSSVSVFWSHGSTLGSGWVGHLGLDEIVVTPSHRTGVSAKGAAMTLGKRLSQDFCLAYETSLRGTMGSLYLDELSQRLPLRAQAGGQSALDIIFRVRRD